VARRAASRPPAAARRDRRSRGSAGTAAAARSAAIRAPTRARRRGARPGGRTAPDRSGRSRAGRTRGTSALRSRMARRTSGGSRRLSPTGGGSSAKRLRIPWASNRAALRRRVRSGTPVSRARAAGGGPTRTIGRRRLVGFLLGRGDQEAELVPIVGGIAARGWFRSTPPGPPGHRRVRPRGLPTGSWVGSNLSCWLTFRAHPISATGASNRARIRRAARYQGVNSFQCPSETTSTAPSTTCMAV
jgi:hypothetical protein